MFLVATSTMKRRLRFNGYTEHVVVEGRQFVQPVQRESLAVCHLCGSFMFDVSWNRHSSFQEKHPDHPACAFYWFQCAERCDFFIRQGGVVEVEMPERRAVQEWHQINKRERARIKRGRARDERRIGDAIRLARLERMRSGWEPTFERFPPLRDGRIHDFTAVEIDRDNQAEHEWLDNVASDSFDNEIYGRTTEWLTE